MDAAIRLATDAELRASMRVNARESVARLQPAQVASDLDDILMRMIRERSPHELSAVA